MLIIPKLRIPTSIEKIVAPSLEVDSLGVRFTHQKFFAEKCIQQIEEVFTHSDAKQKREILYFLRECSRSMFMLPALCSAEMGQKPILKVKDLSPAQLHQLVISCGQYDLALPIFEITASQQFEDIFFLAKALILDSYRGPVFLAKLGEVESFLKENGVLNSLDQNCISLDALNINSLMEILQKMQWHRSRILSLTNPWMFAGVSNPIT